MNIDISNAHCGPRILFLDHTWLRVVIKRKGALAAAFAAYLGVRRPFQGGVALNCRRPGRLLTAQSVARSLFKTETQRTLPPRSQRYTFERRRRRCTLGPCRPVREERRDGVVCRLWLLRRPVLDERRDGVVADRATALCLP